MRKNLARPVEVADFLGKPEKTLREWRYLGLGPRFYRVGRDVRYDWQDVDAWLTAQKVA